MSSVSGKAFDVSLLKRIMAYVRPYRKPFFLAGFIIILLGLLGVYRPYLIGDGIDHYIVSDQDPVGLLNITVLIIGLILVEGLLQYSQTYLSNTVAQSVTIDIRKKLFAHLTKFRLKYFDNTPIGTLVTRCISDIETIADIFSEGLLTIMGDILKLLVVVVVMLLVNWKLALFTMIPIPLLLIATRIFQLSIKKSFQGVRTQVARLNAFVQEHVTGMAIVQIFNREKIEMDRFKAINKEHRKAHIDSVMAYSIFFPVVEILSALSMAFLVWLGVGQSLKGEVSYGDLVEYILYVNMLYRPIRMLADRFNTLQMGMVGSERVFKILDSDSRIVNSEEEDHPIFSGDIQFKNVWFAYNEGDPVIKGIDLEIQSGQTVAFVGATGAGKSSVINLVSRLYEFQEGEIFIDGKDIRKLKEKNIRDNISVVLQDVFLFSDSIHNNITLRDPSISRERVIEAAKRIGAHDFIMRLPGNYDFNVMERGGTLSAGQRQMISFIRAYVFNPKILILDEATSSVDTESELMIQHATEKMTEGRTSLIIAHRLSTIQKADLIVVMEKGRIVEKGTHHQLLQQEGYYKHLFDLQFA